MEPVRLGRVPDEQGLPDRFVVVESADGPEMRVDLYRSSEESFAFEEVCIWSNFVVIGWGHCVYLIELRTHSVSSHDLGVYFGHMYPADEHLMVASAEGLFRFDRDGSLRWRSDGLGIDGVIVHSIEAGLVLGEGEWDPPGGWLPFQVDLKTGQRV